MPSVSYLLFAYNHEEFIERSLMSAFAQTHPDLEIVITDDASSDGTVAIIERMLARYSGPHAVVFRKNAANLGLAAAINGAVEAARSDILVLAAGDDESLPRRTEVVARMFDDAEVHLAFSNARIVDRHGAFGDLHYREPPPERTLDWLATPWSGLLGATVAIRRTLFDFFGPLDRDLVFEDRVLPLRAAIAGRVAYTDEALVLYRHHGGNIWAGVSGATTEVGRWRTHRNRRNEMMMAVCRNRLRDLETGRRLYPQRGAEIGRAVAMAHDYVAVASAENILFGHASLSAKMSILARVATGKIAGGGSLSGWTRKAFSPRRYLAAEMRRQAL